MKNVFIFFLYSSISVVLILFFNGDINIPNVPLPALGKFLNPNIGVWNNANKETSRIEKDFLVEKGVQVIFDERNIPHIFAENDHDAIFTEGYLEASNRLFQMDFISRAATSRLSEVLGDKTLQLDIDRLRKGTDLASQNAVIQMQKQPEVMAILNAYIDGVNAYIDNLKPKDYPIEYKLLGFEPEPWSIKKVADVYAYMMDVLTYNADLKQNNSRALLGDELYNHIYPNLVANDIPVIQDAKSPKTFVERAESDTSHISAIKKVYLQDKPHGVGSNNWAVTGSKSATGKVILCNDPHLMLALPAIWYEMHVINKNYNAYGVSIPGIPGIFIGFNADVAWGLTNVGSDVLDLYKIRWKDKSRTEYFVDGKWEKAKKEAKEIKVKGKPSYIDTSYTTIFGPLRYYSEDTKNDLAAHWVGLDTTFLFDMSVFAKMMKSKSISESEEILRLFSAPALNFIFGDRKGNIALKVIGKLPARMENDGKTIENGTQSANLWKNYIPYEDLPYTSNPSQNYLTSSNQRSTGKDYGYYFTGDWEQFRNKQIHNILNSKDNFTVKQMKNMQGNGVSEKARQFVPLILKNVNNTNAKFIQALTNWDYDYNKNEMAPTLFENIYKKTFMLTYDEIFNYSNEYDIAIPNEQRFIELVKLDSKDKIFDKVGTPKIESFGDLLNEAIDSIKLNVSPESDLQPWGKMKNTSIFHITKLPAFSVQNLDLDGQIDCINAQQEGWGPSWRMVVSMGDKIEAWGVYPGGQSGDPASKNYKNFMDKWARKEHYKLYYYNTKEELKENTASILFINPISKKVKLSEK